MPVDGAKAGTNGNRAGYFLYPPFAKEQRKGGATAGESDVVEVMRLLIMLQARGHERRVWLG